MRKIKFAVGEYYHIYNRGVDKRDAFMDEGDYIRFLKGIKEFNCIDPIGSLYEKAHKEKIVSPASNPQLGIGSQKESLVELICYCLNPNHFHFILRQLTERGISKFMQKLGMGYTNYFNLKNNRSGALFQGRFKAVKIDSNEYLLWVSAYVNANAQIHGLTKDAANYKWCSYPEYMVELETEFPIGNSVSSTVSSSVSSSNLVTSNTKRIITSQFRNKEQFKSFMSDCIITMKEKKELQKYLLD